jgi:acid phosphatase (class A)
MLFRRGLILATCLIATACADSRFPYAPQFVSDDSINVATVLAAPPAVDSKKFQGELKQIIATQKKLSAKEKAAILAEDTITPSMMVLPVLGARYTEEQYPALYTLLRHAASDAWRMGDATQDFWNSPRPWSADSKVVPLVKPINRPGYPSGHTTTNAVWAHVLSDLFPKKKAALFARAQQIGHHRVKAGAHFPHDVEGGMKLAATLATEMKKSAAYQAEFAAAKAEIAAPKATAATPAMTAGCAVHAMQSGAAINAVHAGCH